MSQRRQRYSIHESRKSNPRFEERKPEIYTPFKAQRRTVVIRTTIDRGRRSRVERSPSPISHCKRIQSLSPPRRLPSPFQDRSAIMSPTDSPSGGPKKFVPLPGRLPTKEEEEMAKKDQKEPKDKPKVYVSGHKPRRSADSGFASSSPYSFEERSPDQYSPSPKVAKARGADTQVYEQVASKSRSTNYVLKDGKLVRVAPRSHDSRFEDEYVPGPPATPKPRTTAYKVKYKAAKETTKALHAVVADATEIAQHNYVAAKDQEAKFQSLEEELRRLRLQAQISEAKAAEADRKRMEAERKLRQNEIEKELEEIRLDRERRDRERREREFERRQNDEIAASVSPVTRTRRPTSIDQPHLPKRNALVTTSYSTAALTATASPTVTNASGNPFMDPLDEAAADYDRSQAEVRFSTTDSRRRERQRDDRRYK